MGNIIYVDMIFVNIYIYCIYMYICFYVYIYIYTVSCRDIYMCENSHMEFPHTGEFNKWFSCFRISVFPFIFWNLQPSHDKTWESWRWIHLLLTGVDFEIHHHLWPFTTKKHETRWNPWLLLGPAITPSNKREPSQTWLSETYPP